MTTLLHDNVAIRCTCFLLFFYKIILFISLFLVMLGLHCCSGFLQLQLSGGYSLVMVLRFCIVAASLVVEHRPLAPLGSGWKQYHQTLGCPSEECFCGRLCHCLQFFSPCDLFPLPCNFNVWPHDLLEPKGGRSDSAAPSLGLKKLVCFSYLYCVSVILMRKMCPSWPVGYSRRMRHT